jgi:hypothetical protein
MGGREGGKREHFQFPSFPSFIPLPSPHFLQSSYKINQLHRKPPIIPHPKRLLPVGPNLLMLIPSQPKLAILLLSSLVIIKFSHTERISLRIQSPSAEEGKGQLLNFKYLRNFIKLKAILLLRIVTLGRLVPFSLSI